MENIDKSQKIKSNGQPMCKERNQGSANSGVEIPFHNKESGEKYDNTKHV
jgi:hypothetical protein